MSGLWKASALRSLRCPPPQQMIRACRPGSQRCLSRYRPRVSDNKNFLQISDEVRNATNSNRPVVALETTIYTHGFPFPDNLKLAADMERLVRENGAVPAHIGFLSGSAIVGMMESDLMTMLSCANIGVETIKLSRRDIAYIAAQHRLGKDMNGGTTIAGTMVLAQMAGISVFATGGLGGVHKGGHDSMDISADLTELGRTRMALVSSGCKSFLDIPRTLEFLETQGVCVGTFADGRPGTVDFPAFWTRDSGSPSPRTIKDEGEAAAIIHAQHELGIRSGLLFANPIAEEFSLKKEYMDEVMAQARSDAQHAGITGPANTPYVLSRIRDLTQGATIEANRQLVLANVVRGAKVAVELSKLREPAQPVVCGEEPQDSAKILAPATPPRSQNKLDDEEMASDHEHGDKDGTAKGKVPPRDLYVLGSVSRDIALHATEWELATSNIATSSETLGGVGMNIAAAAAYCGACVRLHTRLGKNSKRMSSKTFRNLYHAVGKITGNRILTITPEYTDGNSASYTALYNGKGELHTAAADMSIFELSPEARTFATQPPSSIEPNSRNAPIERSWLAVDANFSPDKICEWLVGRSICKVAFEPVSTAKATRIVDAFILRGNGQSASPSEGIDLITPNQLEVATIADYLKQLSNQDQSKLPIPQFVDPGVQNLEALQKAAEEILLSVSWSSRVDDESAKTFTPLSLVDAVALLSISRTVAVTLGAKGVLVVQRSGGDEIPKSTLDSDIRFDWAPQTGEGNHDAAKQSVIVKHFPSAELDKPIVNVNGAGDTFTGVLLAGIINGLTLNRAVDLAQRAAVKSLQSKESVNPAVSEVFRDFCGSLMHQK